MVTRKVKKVSEEAREVGEELGGGEKGSKKDRRGSTNDLWAEYPFDFPGDETRIILNFATSSYTKETNLATHVNQTYVA